MPRFLVSSKSAHVQMQASWKARAMESAQSQSESSFGLEGIVASGFGVSGSRLWAFGLAGFRVSGLSRRHSREAERGTLGSRSVAACRS